MLLRGISGSFAVEIIIDSLYQVLIDFTLIPHQQQQANATSDKR
jgi:hypothetical protein